MLSAVGKYCYLFILFLLLPYTVYRFGYDVVRPPGMIPTDFTVFYTAAERLTSGQMVYQPTESSPFKYSPSFLLAFRYTLSFFSKWHAWNIWVFFSVLMFLVTCFWFLRNQPLTKYSLGAFIVSLIFSWHGYIEHFSYGQSDMLILGAFATSVLCFERGYQLVSSLAFATCVLTKPPTLLFLIYFLWKRNYWVCIQHVFVSFILLLLPGFYFGLDGLLELFFKWKECLSIQQTPAFYTGNLNQSVGSVLARVLNMRGYVHYLTVSTLIVALALFWKKAVSLKRSSKNLFCLTILFYLLITPLSWRWLSFIWLPIIFHILNQVVLTKSKKILLILSCMIGLLLQSKIAYVFGIKEVDELSFFGFYMIQNILLTLLL